MLDANARLCHRSTRMDGKFLMADSRLNLGTFPVASKARHGPRRWALQFRRGAMIESLAHEPIRKFSRPAIFALRRLGRLRLVYGLNAIENLA